MARRSPFVSLIVAARSRRSPCDLSLVTAQVEIYLRKIELLQVVVRINSLDFALEQVEDPDKLQEFFIEDGGAWLQL